MKLIGHLQYKLKVNGIPEIGDYGLWKGVDCFKSNYLVIIEWIIINIIKILNV